MPKGKPKLDRKGRERKFLCLNRACRAVVDEGDTVTPAYDNDEVMAYMLEKWKGDVPDTGCPKCGWPAWEAMIPVKDISLGRDLAAEGMANASKGVTEEWRSAVLALVYRTARGLRRLSTNDLYPEVVTFEVLNDGKRINYSSLGPVMAVAAGEGWIEWTPETTKSTIPGQHGRPKRVWRSMVSGEWGQREEGGEFPEPE